jgi:hypothetical protein
MPPGSLPQARREVLQHDQLLHFLHADHVGAVEHVADVGADLVELDLVHRIAARLDAIGVAVESDDLAVGAAARQADVVDDVAQAEGVERADREFLCIAARARRTGQHIARGI